MSAPILLLFTVVLPLLAGPAPRLVLHHQAPGAVRQAADAIGLWAGFLVGYWAAWHDQWRFPPVQAMDWPPICLAAALLLFTGWDTWKKGAAPPAGLSLLVSAVTTVVLLAPLYASWPLTDSITTSLFLAGGGSALWRLAALGAAPLGGRALLAAIACEAIVIALAGSLLIGEMGVALAAAFVGAYGYAGRSGPVPSAGRAVAMTGLGCLAILGHFFADVGWGIALLPPAGILTAAVLSRGRPDRARTARQGLAMALAALVPGLAAVGWAIAALLAQPAGY